MGSYLFTLGSRIILSSKNGVGIPFSIDLQGIVVDFCGLAGHSKPAALPPRHGDFFLDLGIGVAIRHTLAITIYLGWKYRGIRRRDAIGALLLAPIFAPPNGEKAIATVFTHFPILRYSVAG